MSKNTVIRYRFGVADSKLYGAGVVLLESGAAQTSGFNFTVSDDARLASIDLDMAPEKFADVIRAASAKNEGTLFSSLERDCSAALKAELKNVIGPYHKAIASNSETELRGITSKLLRKPVMTAGFLTQNGKLNLELTLRDTVGAADAAGTAGAAGAAGAEALPDPTASLPRIEVDPVVSPVSGIPARKLAVGQDVQVTLVDDEHYRAHFGRPRDEGPKILGKLGKITLTDKSEAELVIILKPNLAGICTVPQDARMKTSADTPAAPASDTTAVASPAKSSSFPMGPVIGIAALLLLGALFFLI